MFFFLNMNKYFNFFVMLIIAIIFPKLLSANDTNFTFSQYLLLQNNNVLGIQKSFSNDNKVIIQTDAKFRQNNFLGKISFRANEKKNVKLDGSYLQYTKNNKTFGIGAIDRHWSYSKRTSLILTDNARPSKSIYLQFNKSKTLDKNQHLKIYPWSFEIFNGIIDNNNHQKDTNLLGMRATFSPNIIKNLNIELLKISQWGKTDNHEIFSDFFNALIGNTNEGKHSSTNSMAGIGFSYQPENYIYPFNIYGQFIGEDESGNLPNCFVKLYGLELGNFKNKYKTVFGIEGIDTRINFTENNNCGPNTAYNNTYYKYTNDNIVMGTPIDSESTSMEIFGNTQISTNLNVEYSIKKVVINDKNFSAHRLSSDRKKGYTKSLGLHWNDSKYTAKLSINHQNFELEKAKIRHGINFNLYTGINF
jgi:hypothetical protein